MGYFILSLCASLMLCQSAFALTMGRDGESYVVNGVKWQPVHFEDEARSLKAIMPGDPTTHISCANGECSTQIQGNYGKSAYALKFYGNPAPKKIEELIEMFRDEYYDITPLTPVQKTVKYMLEINIYKDASYTKLNAVARVFSTKTMLYVAVVQGDDFSLANAFFESVDIVK